MNIAKLEPHDRVGPMEALQEPVCRAATRPCGALTPRGAGLGACLALLAFGTATSSLAEPPLWAAPLSMGAARKGHSAAVLLAGPRAGHVVVTGGDDGLNIHDTMIVYDPSAGTFGPLEPMPQSRSRHSTVAMPDGSLLVIGGYGKIGATVTVLQTASKYDSITNNWSDAGSVDAPRLDHASLLLGDGRVLVTGGQDLASTVTDTARLFDGAWGAAGDGTMFSARSSHTATLLDDGRVLVVGGRGPGSTTLDAVEMFDSAANAWQPVAKLNSGKTGHCAAKFSDGRVLVVQGGAFPGEIYDPQTNQWKSIGAPPEALIWCTLTPLVNGWALLAGGFASVLNVTTALAYVFDPDTEQFYPAGSMSVARAAHTASALENGDVLIVGGKDGDTPHATAELFTLVANGGECNVGGHCRSGNCVEGYCCEGVGQPGAACQNACECESANCVDGVCCQVACNGSCEACGSDGVCKPVAEGADPDNDCVDVGAASCGNNGACDGKGACQLYAQGTACGDNACTGSTVVTSTCNGAGECLTTSQDCAPYLCTASLTCGSSCQSAHDCAEPNVCNKDNTCGPYQGGTSDTPVEIGGCGCRVHSDGPDERTVPLLAVAALGGLALRRRRRLRGRETR